MSAPGASNTGGAGQPGGGYGGQGQHGGGPASTGAQAPSAAPAPAPQQSAQNLNQIVSLMASYCQRCFHFVSFAVSSV